MQRKQGKAKVKRLLQRLDYLTVNGVRLEYIKTDGDVDDNFTLNNDPVCL